MRLSFDNVASSVRALPRKLKVFAGGGRPVTVVEVWARPVQCGARGARSKYFRRELIRRFPGVLASTDRGLGLLQ